MPTFQENLAGLKGVDDISRIVLYQNGQAISVIPNENGKKGSLKVFANLVGFENGTLTDADITSGLELFAEHTEDARLNPGKHPNIDILLRDPSAVPIKVVIDYKIPNDLQERVEKHTAMKKAGTLTGTYYREPALETFNEVMDLLERGHLRTANYVDGRWQANSWVKSAILLGFYLGNVKVIYSGDDIQFTDKITFPLRKINEDSGIRVTPPAAAIRRGAYAGRGTVFMSPAYVNFGAYVGQGTMVELLAGSCSQVGRNSHISAGAVIGGVLDPVEATPVILGDNILIGEGSGVTQGTRLDDLVTLASGVHISKGTPVLDPINGVAYTSQGVRELEEVKIGSMGSGDSIILYRVGKFMQEKDPSFGPEVPRGALVVPGIILSRSGTLRVAPTIAKYISNPSERPYALEEALRS